jgi:hypothetical protein
MEVCEADINSLPNWLDNENKVKILEYIKILKDYLKDLMKDLIWKITL